METSHVTRFCAQFGFSSRYYGVDLNRNIQNSDKIRAANGCNSHQARAGSHRHVNVLRRLRGACDCVAKMLIDVAREADKPFVDQGQPFCPPFQV